MLTWNYPPTVGGIEQVAHHTAGGLFHRGHSVRVIVPALPAGLHEVTEYDIPLFRAGTPGIPHFLIHAVLSGCRLIRAARPNVLLCPSLTSAPAAWLLSRRFHIPYAIQIHGSDILLPRRAYQLAIAPLLSGARMLFANSRNTANLLEKRGLDPKRIRVVCPGVTPPPPPTAQPTPGILRLLEQNAGAPLSLQSVALSAQGIQSSLSRPCPCCVSGSRTCCTWCRRRPKASLIHHERMGSSNGCRRSGLMKIM
jgi:hypothetical protein